MASQDLIVQRLIKTFEISYIKSVNYMKSNYNYTKDNPLNTNIENLTIKAYQLTLQFGSVHSHTQNEAAPNFS